jgi:hypothetical protein
MTYLFYAIAAVMIAVALFLVLRPLLHRGRRDGQPRGIFALALSVAFVLPLAAIGLYALVGYNYKDEAADAKAWLAQHGNPYRLVVADRGGQTAIDFGVYGAPETFLIDARGMIRYKRIGPLTPQVIADELKPAIAALKREGVP